VNAFSQIDYLVVGHISRDIVPGGYAPGGTAVYAALAAQALGCRTAVITSVDPAYDVESILTGIAVCNVASDHTTVFANTHEGSTRRQSVFSVAGSIRPDDVPLSWRRPSIVHLGPIVGEIEPDVIRLFSNSMIGLTPQGWFRRWGDDKQVYAGDWPDAATVTPLAAAVITSLEDLPDPGYLDRLRQWSPLVVLTHGKGGCTVYSRDEERHFDAPPVHEVNPTGAGDIFAAAFLVRLHQTNGNPWEAALFANHVAARSVTEDDLLAKTETIKGFVERRN
jgi:sugar/nucleoside kinase (ribokinase family)